MKLRTIIAVAFTVEVILIGVGYLLHFMSGEERQFLWCCDWLELFGYALFMFVFAIMGVWLIIRKRSAKYLDIFLGLVLIVISAGAFLFQWICMTCALS